MSDVVSEAPSAAAGSPDPGTRTDASEAFGVHAATNPTLAWLTVFAALTSMAINQLLLPALGPDAKRTLLTPLERWGRVVVARATYTSELGERAELSLRIATFSGRRFPR